MATYVCWEIDILFSVNSCQNNIKHDSSCRLCIQVKITITDNVLLFREILELYNIKLGDVEIDKFICNSYRNKTLI